MCAELILNIQAILYKEAVMSLKRNSLFFVPPDVVQ